MIQIKEPFDGSQIALPEELAFALYAAQTLSWNKYVECSVPEKKDEYRITYEYASNAYHNHAYHILGLKTPEALHDYEKARGWSG